eukprot:4804568-Prymnesium_polylepis.2
MLRIARAKRRAGTEMHALGALVAGLTGHSHERILARGEVLAELPRVRRDQERHEEGGCQDSGDERRHQALDATHVEAADKLTGGVDRLAPEEGACDYVS